MRMAKCHPDRKHDALGLCDSCYQSKWAREHPNANTGNNWSRNHPDRSRGLNRIANWKRHGLGMTAERYEEMWTKQAGKCANASCRETSPLAAADFRRDALQVDHDHVTGQVRGLLCPGCNRALGLVDDDPLRLAGLIEYLRNS